MLKKYRVLDTAIIATLKYPIHQLYHKICSFMLWTVLCLLWQLFCRLPDRTLNSSKILVNCKRLIVCIPSVSPKISSKRFSFCHKIFRLIFRLFSANNVFLSLLVFELRIFKVVLDFSITCYNNYRENKIILLWIWMLLEMHMYEWIYFILFYFAKKVSKLGEYYC